MAHDTLAQRKPKKCQCQVHWDLSGNRILFVGGRLRHVVHLRRLVESLNGSFAHHDGGVEESMRRLGSELVRADAVLFPVGCVSHAAQNKVKDLCRQLEKPFKPLFSTGLDAITQALEVMVLSSGIGIKLPRSEISLHH